MTISMCGPETTDRPRGGALVALGPPITPDATTSLADAIRGDLAFHTPGSPGSTSATHARLTPSAAEHVEDLSSLHVVIHSSGDLTRRVADCGLFRQFQLPGADARASRPFVELPLDRPLQLAVGDEGIIGRRVSLCARPADGRDGVVAEGIVGFNYLEQTRSAL